MRLNMEGVEAYVEAWIAADKGVKISGGNHKLGKFPNISVMPCVDCPGSTQLCREACYDLRGIKMMPNVKAARLINSWYARNNLQRLKNDVKAYCRKHKPELFRVHVGGDMISALHLTTWKMIAWLCPDTRFLVFTKSFKLPNWDKLPPNMVVMWSVFPDADLSGVPVEGARAYTDFSEFGIEFPESERARVSRALKCPGSCQTCKVCFYSDKTGADVVFRAHGGWVNARRNLRGVNSRFTREG